MAVEGQVAVCAPDAFELGHPARSHSDYTDLTSRLLDFPSAPVNDADMQRALEVQGKLSARGEHRGVSLVDVLVAATAETRNVTVLHYDADFALISAITGQDHKWIVERGSVG